MQKSSAIHELEHQARMLPEVCRTRGGAEFYPRATLWAYREGLQTVSLDFGKLSHLNPNLVENLKHVLVWYAENVSASHLLGMFNRFVHLARHADIGAQITGVTLINYRASLPAEQAWYVGSLAVLIRQWNALGFSGVTADAIKFLDDARLKRNAIGEAVRTRDPQHGPLTDLELEAVHQAVNEAFASAAMDLDTYLLVWLFILLGQRPVQYAALKVCDFKVVETKGSKEYVLRVPRAKQRQGIRTSFKERLLIAEVGALLEQHTRAVEDSFAGKLLDPTQAPLFPERESRETQPDGFLFHQSANMLGRRISEAISALKVQSERTGGLLNLHPTRLRRTVGTRAAAEGHGPLIIAELLDHSTTKSVGVYVESVPEIVERIDRAVAMQLAPLAQAFAGVLVTDESEAERGADSSSRIVDPRFDPTMKPMGSCGSHGFCGFLAPIACYTCKSFQPWLDGPHEAVLAHLLKERERLLPRDTRIATINDRTILAVAEVIQQCEAVRVERTEQGRLTNG